MHSITFLKFYAFGIQMKSRSCGNGSGEAAGPAAEMISVDSWKGGHMGEKDMGMHEKERDVAKYWMKNGRIAELFRKLSDASVRDCVSDGETVEDVLQRFWNHSRIYCEKKEE